MYIHNQGKNHLKFLKLLINIIGISVDCTTFYFVRVQHFDYFCDFILWNFLKIKRRIQIFPKLFN